MSKIRCQITEQEERTRLKKQQYGLSGYRMRAKQPYGVELGLLASVVLAGSSVPRAIKSQKPLPIGLSVLALFGLFNFGMAFQQGRKF